MRRLHPVAFAGAVLLVALFGWPVASPTPEGLAQTTRLEDLRGSDWAGLSRQQKEYFVFSGYGALEQQGVPLKQKPYHYIEALDKLLSVEPSLAGEYLDDLLLFCVNESEPEARPVLKRLRAEQKKTLGNGSA
ncbi:MAG: hypothetical protein MOGMAGMI_00063 [Candidatus Omnitrophica bacterium]|nr:hypothetical protein [Candidatus Omnitrophota bacterium]